MEKIPGEFQERNKNEVAILAFEGAHLGLQYVNGVARGKGPVTEEVIKEIHRRCMENLLPEGVAGRYRTLDVGISRASVTPPPRSRVPLLMGLFVSELNSKINSCNRGINNLPKFIRTLAFAHYVFVRIHPFEDGNGRSVRLLCDLIAKKFGIRPIIVWPSERDEYIKSLEAVNRSGELAHLELFLIERLVERYNKEKVGRNGDICRKLEDLRGLKRREIEEQTGKRSGGEIWEVLEWPCFS